jgi:hypothetical protein
MSWLLALDMNLLPIHQQLANDHILVRSLQKVKFKQKVEFKMINE